MTIRELGSAAYNLAIKLKVRLTTFEGIDPIADIIRYGLAGQSALKFFRGLNCVTEQGFLILGQARDVPTKKVRLAIDENISDLITLNKESQNTKKRNLEGVYLRELDGTIFDCIRKDVYGAFYLKEARKKYLGVGLPV